MRVPYGGWGRHSEDSHAPHVRQSRTLFAANRNKLEASFTLVRTCCLTAALPVLEERARRASCRAKVTSSHTDEMMTEH